MKLNTLTRLGLVALLAGSLAACSGSNGSSGSTGATGATGAAGAAGATGPAGAPANAPTFGSNASTPSAAAAAAWVALQPQVAVQSVSIHSPPVVTFTVKDAAGNAVTGLGSTSQSATATVPSLTNIAFTLAKLVPGANGAPSKWVSYIVTKPVTVAQKAGTLGANDVCDSATAPTVCGTFPTTDTQGTLVDHGDGSYTYTFYRDVTKVDTVGASLIDKGAGHKADLGTAADLAYDANATTRLGIMISGSLPGTGTNTPNATAAATAAVPLVNTLNLAYDFIPATGAAAVPGTNATRTIVLKDSCSACHAGKGIGHVSITSATNGIPPGSFVGRNDPNFCVTCHTDQTKFGFAPVATTATGYSGAYYRVPTGAADAGQEAAFIYPRMIHQTHMGDELIKTGYNLNGHCNTATNSNLAQCYNLVGFPQDQRNCTRCHAGATSAAAGTAAASTDGDNWLNVPSRLACGACHDGINFVDGSGTQLNNAFPGLGHIGGSQADDSKCAGCHKAADIQIYHAVPVATPNSPKTIAGVSKISYSISSVTVVANQPVITFSITKDGAKVTSLPVPTLVTNSQTGAQVVSPAYEPIPGFADGPTLAVYYAVPQDGIAAPADFNASASASLTNLLIAAGSPKAGSLSNTVTAGAYQADANGNFTATLTGNLIGQPANAACAAVTAPTLATCISTVVTGSNKSPVLASPIVIPASAKMVTGAMYGLFTQKAGFPTTINPAYTAANLTTVNPTVAAVGGLPVGAMLQKMTATTYTGRRVVVSTAKCNNCHDMLGTNPAFHGTNEVGGINGIAGSGPRNDATSCAFCHTANRVSGGAWTADSRTWIHGIHAGNNTNGAPTTIRTQNFMPDSPNSLGWQQVLYPGVIKNCSQCHLPNTVNFGSTGGQAVAPNLLWPAVATGNITAGATTSPYIPTTYALPYNFGNGFTYTAAGATVSAYTPSNGSGGAGVAVAAHVAGAGGETVPAQNTTLVNSAIASACFACHDTSTAKGHMTTNGGAIYEARATALLKSEACLACHGQGGIVDAEVVHQQ